MNIRDTEDGSVNHAEQANALVPFNASAARISNAVVDVAVARSIANGLEVEPNNVFVLGALARG